MVLVCMESSSSSEASRGKAKMEKLGQRIADSELEGIWSWYQQMSNTPRKVLQDIPQSHGEDELELSACLLAPGSPSYFNIVPKI